MLGFQVALTDANTNYNLLALVQAIDSGFVDQGEFTIQAEDDGGAQVILVGDSNLAADRYGWKLTAGDSMPKLKSLLGVYARCDLAAKKLNVFVAR